MQRIASTLTVFFEDPFWVGVYERVEDGKLGRKTGEGIYAWDDGEPRKDEGGGEIPDDAQDRLVLPMLDAAVECLRRGVVADADTLDAAMVFATGFAPFRGGPMQCLKRWGPERVRERLEHLAEHLGPRFRPCQREEHSQIVSRIVN